MSFNRTNQSSHQIPKLPWEHPYGDLPDTSKNTKEWLTETDKICKIRFDSSEPLPFDRDRGQPEPHFLCRINENVLQEIVGARRFACSTHLQLSKNATELITQHDFEEKWRALGEKGREKYLLTAFKEQQTGVAKTFSMNGPEKLNCPELSWDALAKDGGNGFLDLLKDFMLNNNDETPAQPFVMEQPRYNEIIGWDERCSPAQKAWLDFRRLRRTHHIEVYCSMVLAEYIGKKVKYQSFAHEHSKTKETLAGVKTIINHFMDPSETKQWMKNEAARRKGMKLFCENCFKAEDKKEGKMNVCVPCNRIGREVRYCSRDCQKKAWKGHKHECGKKLNVDSAFQDVNPIHRPGQVMPREDIPPAAPGHRRTPHLLQQISFLNECPDKDYVMLMDGDFLGITLDELHGATIFNIMRNQAMHNADESALFYVYRVLQRWEFMVGCGSRVLLDQLRKEYGIAFENVMKAVDGGNPPAPPKVSTEEIDKMLVFLKKKSRRFVPELRNYNPGIKGKKTLPRGIQVGPKKDLTVIMEWPEDTAIPLVSVVPLGAINPHVRSGQSPDDLGPNHPSSIPTPHEGFRRPALEKQLNVLRDNPSADYILWGNTEDPTVPCAVNFEDIKDCITFLAYRRRLFEHGASTDPDALVYIIMVLETAVLRKKIPKEVLRAQLAREYSEDCVRTVVECIKGGQYHWSDGKMCEVGEIPVTREDMAGIPRQLKAAGRFPDIMKNLKT